MFFAKLLTYLRGYVIITVSGRYPERFLNVCAARRILVWDVFPCGERSLKCCVSMRAFGMLAPVARKTDVHIKILKKCGFPMLLRRLKKRRWFAFGLLLCILLLILVNQFVWKIEINGCETVSAAHIRQKLADFGLTIGTFRPHIDEKALQNQMLSQVPELSWIWVDKHGSKVTVEVEERVMPPELYDADALCNLAASKDGVIESMVIKHGTPLVSLGDTVCKGDILVSGLLLSEKGVPPRTTQSEGEIYARVWYEKTKAFSLWQPIRKETGQIENKYTLHIFGKDIPLFRTSETNFEEYITEKSEQELRFFGRYLGLGLSRTKYTELSVSYEKSTAESAAQKGILELSAVIDEAASPGGEQRNLQSNYEILDEDTVEVTVTAEYIEDIAEKVWLQTP